MHLPKKSQEKRDKEHRDKQKKEKEDKRKQDRKDKEQKKKMQEQEEAQEAAVEMTEDEVTAAREEALGKLETPLEKMKIKDLLKLLEERNVECKNCKGAEKSHIVAQVREGLGFRV